MRVKAGNGSNDRRHRQPGNRKQEPSGVEGRCCLWSGFPRITQSKYIMMVSAGESQPSHSLTPELGEPDGVPDHSMYKMLPCSCYL